MYGLNVILPWFLLHFNSVFKQNWVFSRMHNNVVSLIPKIQKISNLLLVLTHWNMACALERGFVLTKIR